MLLKTSFYNTGISRKLKINLRKMRIFLVWGCPVQLWPPPNQRPRFLFYRPRFFSIFEPPPPPLPNKDVLYGWCLMILSLCSLIPNLPNRIQESVGLPVFPWRTGKCNNSGSLKLNGCVPKPFYFSYLIFAAKKFWISSRIRSTTYQQIYVSQDRSALRSLEQ